jgi:hypothetical protein
MPEDKTPSEILTVEEADRIRILITTHGIMWTTRRLGLCDRRTLERALARVGSHRLSIRCIRASLGSRI